MANFTMQNSGAERAESGQKLPRVTNKRRRSPRQQVHLPGQIILSGKAAVRNNQPIEIVDLSEDGACILTSSPLAPDSQLTLSLDLLETNTFVATPGVVVWSDQRGRNGVYFDGIPEASRQQLKEWLAARPITPNRSDASNEFRARPLRSQAAGDDPRRTVKREFVKQSPEQMRAALAASSPLPELSSQTAYPSVLSALVAVKREVEGTRNDLDKALQLIAERALSLTHASGAAIALGKEKGASEMICLANAGSDAPGLGAKLQVGSGFSGECVRAGKTLRCNDAELDPRVDREGCRALGIRAIIATPVKRDDAVIGLLEVFSPLQNAFASAEEKIVERLAEMIGATLDRTEAKSAAPPLAQAASAPAPKVVPRLERLETPIHLDQLAKPAFFPLRRLVYVLLAAAVILGSLWMILAGPSGKKLSSSIASSSGPEASSSTQSPSASPQVRSSVSRPSDLDSLRKLATEGDPNAQFDMGARYATGEDVKQDYTESVRWFTLAAQQGHVIAQATLGAYYWAGRGITQDLSKAYFWSAVAQAGGDAASRYRVTVLAARMQHSQVAAAQREADDWLKQHQVPARKGP